jgi:hypothetical protein
MRRTRRHLIVWGGLAWATIGWLAAQDHADCDKAIDVCSKKSITISRAYGEGSDNREADFTPCFMGSENAGQAEENSTWFKWEIVKGGTFFFTIRPHNPIDDIDFVVYRIAPGGNCNNRQIVRCMAAGDTLRSSRCLGTTGLRDGETDSSEDAGCKDPDDNPWLAPLRTSDGERYVLLVSNVTTKGPGFDISFGGTATLPCEKTKKKPEKPIEKPKPATTPPAVAATRPAPAPETKITEIGGRAVEVGETVKVKNRKIKIKIWDSQVEDGDIISVYLDDKKIIDRLYLRLKPQEFEVTLPTSKKDFLITVYADDFGKAEPNTAMLRIDDGVRQQTIDLVAGRKKQESVKIIME